MRDLSFPLRGGIASTILILGATTACGSSSEGGASSGQSSGPPAGYGACYDRYFAKILQSCSPSDDCGALTCGVPDNCPVDCSDRCRGARCDTAHPVSSCAGVYDSLCTQSSSEPFYFSCFQANSFDEPQCNIMGGTAPACTNASHLGPGC